MERWSTTRMRADNTSVVIIMLDPPGPPKRDVLKACPSQSYQMDYLTVPQTGVADEQTNHLESEPNDNFTMFDHSTNEHIDLDAIPLPTNGLAIMTRYEHTNDSDFIVDKHQNGYVSVVDNSQTNTDVPYMNSFAESYNSLLNSSLENDHSYIYNNDQQDENVGDVDFDDDSGDGSGNPYVNSSQMDTYSLTKLQTRSEQQRSMYGESSASTSTSVMDDYFSDYQHNLDHNYVSNIQSHPTYGSMSNDYISYGGHSSNLSAHTVHMNVTPLNAGEYVTNSFHNLHTDYYADRKLVISPSSNDITIIRNCHLKPKTYRKASSDKYSSHMANSENNNRVIEHDYMSMDNSLEDSIQINEISSSNASESKTAASVASTSRSTPNATTKTKTIQNKCSISTLDSIGARKLTRSSYALSQRITRSSKLDQKYNQIFKKCKSVMKKTDMNNRKTIQGLKTTLEALISKRTNSSDRARLHKENLSLLRKMRSIQKNKLRSKSRDASLAAAALNCHANIGRRMLRSQNNLTKEQGDDTHTIATLPNTQPSVTITESKLVAKDVNDNKGDSRNGAIICTRQLRSSSPSPISANLRCKLIMSKKPVVLHRCNAFLNDVGKTALTRRTRLNH